MRAAQRSARKKQGQEQALLDNALALLARVETEHTAEAQWDEPLRARDFDRRVSALTAAANKVGGLLVAPGASDVGQKLFACAEFIQKRRTLFDVIRSEPESLVINDMSADSLAMLQKMPPYLKAGVLQTAVFHIVNKSTLAAIKHCIDIARFKPSCVRLNISLISKEDSELFEKCQVSLTHAIVDKAVRALSINDFMVLGAWLGSFLDISECDWTQKQGVVHEAFAAEPLNEFAALRLLAEVHRLTSVQAKKVPRNLLQSMQQLVEGKGVLCVRVRSMCVSLTSGKENHAKTAWDAMEDFIKVSPRLCALFDNAKKGKYALRCASQPLLGSGGHA